MGSQRIVKIFSYNKAILALLCIVSALASSQASPICPLRKPIVVAIMGAPGSGKGTQSQLLVKALGIPHISLGAVLRAEVAAKTDIGKKADGIMRSGGLVPDELVLTVLRKRLAQDDCKHGFILDGATRRLGVIHDFEKLLAEFGKKIDVVVSLRVGKQELKRRVLGRRVCPTCETSYHIDTLPPKIEGVCDQCGTDLIQRADDELVSFQHRMEVYADETLPVLEYFKAQKLLCVVAAGTGTSPVQVLNRILKKCLK